MDKAARAIWSEAERVADAFVRRPEVRAVFGYGPLQEEAVRKDPGYGPAVPLGRMDLFLAEGRPRILEFNTDGAAGWHYAAALQSLWEERTGRPAQADPLPLQLLKTLLRCWELWSGGAREKPRAALVDFRGVGTRAEQEALAAFFTSRGMETTVEDPRVLRFRGGILEGPAGPIDLVYRRLVSEEAFARPEDVSALLEAYLRGAVCLVGSFRSDPAWSKTFLALLSDPDLHPLWGGPPAPDAQEAVPWTRIVREGDTLFEGARVDLRRLLLENRRGFLLKPSRSLEGRGVAAGPYLSESLWREAVHRALDSPGSYVVQTFVRPGSVLYPDGVRRVPQPGAFVLQGRLAGLWGRAGRTEVIAPGRREWYLPVEVRSS